MMVKFFKSAMTMRRHTEEVIPLEMSVRLYKSHRKYTPLNINFVSSLFLSASYGKGSVVRCAVRCNCTCSIVYT